MIVRNKSLQLAIFLTATGVGGCKNRSEDDANRRSRVEAQQSSESTPSEAAAEDAVASEVQEPKAVEQLQPSSEGLSKSAIPENGEIASAVMQKTSGIVLSGRTNTGTVSAIPKASSYLKPMGGAFTQLYDLHSDNFAVGTVGITGEFAYVMYLNSTLGYVHPGAMTLMYCEPQLVSQSVDVVAVLDCMDAMPISKISKTSKYGNGNPVFGPTGDLLYEDGSKAFDQTKWLSANGRVMFQGGQATYGNGKAMRAAAGDVFFSTGNKAFDKAAAKLLFADGSSFATKTKYLYQGNKPLADLTSLAGTFYYTGATPQKVLAYSRGAVDGPRSNAVFYKNGVQALVGAKTFRSDGSEAPVEVYGSDETMQNSVIWSASQLYTSLSISQYSKEATFNVYDEYASEGASNTEIPPNPVDLLLTAKTHTDMVANWKSGGAGTNGFVYKVLEGATAPEDCVGGTAVNLQTSVLFGGLKPSTQYSVRVCAQGGAGQMSSGAIATATTPAAPPAPPKVCTVYESEKSPYHLVGKADGQGWAGLVASHRANYLQYGPYVKTMKAGNSEAVFRMMIDNNSKAQEVKVLTIDVRNSTKGQILAARHINRSEFVAPNKYQEFALGFVAPGDSSSLEFRVYWYDNANVNIDRVSYGEIGACPLN